MNPFGIAFLLAASVSALAAAEPAGWAPNVTATALWNSNVTNANRSPDIIGAFQLRADVDAFSRRVPLGHDDSLTVGVDAGVEAWPRFDGLDRAALGPRLAWRHKFGLGALAPVFSVEAAAEGVAARESDRSGWAGRIKVGWRRRFETGTQLALSYEQARHDAHGAVFDRAGGEAAVEVSHELNETWRLALAARWREGDVLSYATPPRPDLVAIARVRTLVDTFGAPRVAYSVSARTLGGSVGFIRDLDERSSLALGYEARTTERDSLRYVNHLVSAAYTRQF